MTPEDLGNNMGDPGRTLPPPPWGHTTKYPAMSPPFGLTFLPEIKTLDIHSSIHIVTILFIFGRERGGQGGVCCGQSFLPTFLHTKHSGPRKRYF